MEAFGRNGYHFPVRAISAAEADAYRGRVEEFEFDHGLIMKTPYRNKPHMVFKWANELIRHPHIVDTVEDILGPEPAGLGHQLLHQGAQRSRLCVLAPGLDLLGPVAS